MESLPKSTCMCIIQIYKYIEHYRKYISIENIFQTHHTNLKLKKVSYTFLIIIKLILGIIKIHYDQRL